MHKASIDRAVLVAVLALASAPSAATEAHAEARRLFEEFRCSQCHGLDGKTATVTGVPTIAGRNADEIYIKSKRYIDGEPQNLAWKGCGETPNYKEVRAISMYLSSLPGK